MSLYHLSSAFIQKYVGKQPKWGPIGYVTYKRTYARDLDKVYQRHADLGTAGGLVGNEEFWLTLVRVTEGTFGILRDHCLSLRLPWSDEIAQKKAQEMFTLMWDFKFTPPGRGLWMMGTPAVAKVGGAALNSCMFLSSQNIDIDFADPFCTLMDFSMLGVGVGGDTRGAGKITIQEPAYSGWHTVADSREGWVAVLRIVLNAYVGICAIPEFDYSLVRLAGSPIKGFGGTASGPGPLIELVSSLRTLLDARVGQVIVSSDITDIFNMVGRCVVAGGVRRTAEILFGDSDDDVFLELKDRDKNGAALDAYRWASNNSIFAKVGQSYDKVAKRTAKNGEPGYSWLKNAQDYGRMGDVPDYKDKNARGGNPCLPGDTMIDTSEGNKTVLELLGKPFAAKVNGRLYPSATGFFHTGYKQLLEVTTENGYTIRLTPNHEMLVSRFPDVWVEAGDLLPGDFVVMNGGFQERVLRIKQDAIQHVYDCTVDEIHRFSANGFIVHNCLEQTLHDHELCCLVETYPFHHSGVKEFQRTLKFAYLYAKVVTLVPTHDQKTNAVTMKNRRIGCSMAGIVQAMSKFGRRGFLNMCDSSYAYVRELDKEYSGWLCIPESIKKTSVKPGGTTPLLSQSTPGIHHPISEYYYRVIRFATDSKMLPALRKAGHQCIEISPAKEPNTTAVYFPVKEEGFERAAKDVSMWEQLELAAALQAHWADNQVSVTVSFDKITEGPQIARALELYETRLKGVSFLPHNDHGYEHAPYQPITKEEYESAIGSLGVLDLSVTSHETTDAFCDGDKCLLPTVTS